jgi:hypothetical protein
MEPMVWEQFRWRCGADTFRFEIEEGGLYGKITASFNGSEEQTRSLTLPMVAWEGLLDSLKANRTTRSRKPQSLAPLRAGARWTDAEIAELEDRYRQKRPIHEIAEAHARTTAAIEQQLEKMGLWMRDHGTGYRHT